MVFQEWWRLTLLVLFPLGPPSGLGVGAGCGGGQEAPCKHLDSGWVRGWCWAKPGVPSWRVEPPPGTGRGRLSCGLPPHHRTKQWLKPEWRPGGARALPAPGTRAGFKQEACGSPSPKSLELRAGRWEPKQREEEEGKSGQGGQAGSVVLLPPSSAGAGVAESVALEVGDNDQGRSGGRWPVWVSLPASLGSDTLLPVSPPTCYRDMVLVYVAGLHTL